MENRFALKKGNSYGYTINKICIKCNGGWMSQLEENVKEIITVNSHIFKSSIDDIELNEFNSKNLALWCIVKALLLSIKNVIIPTIPRKIIEDLKDGVISNNFLVEIAEIEESDMNFMGGGMTNRFRLKEKEQNVIDELNNKYIDNFFIVTIQIGYFMFRISYFDEACGFKREACIKETKVLFPFNYEMPYFKIENEKELWNNFSNKFMIFHNALSLIDTNTI